MVSDEKFYTYTRQNRCRECHKEKAYGVFPGLKEEKNQLRKTKDAQKAAQK